MMSPRIALIHATALAIDPINAAFATGWPAAHCLHKLDDSLPADLQRTGLDSAMHQRFIAYAQWAQVQGANGILFTCSAFGVAIESAKQAIALPMLKPNEAMFAEALQQCAALGGQRRIGLATTFAPAGESMMIELNEAIVQKNISVTAKSVCAEGAMALKSQGQVAQHDAMVLAVLHELSDCDVVLLGQFSMAHLRHTCEAAVGKPVLCSPDSAVRAMQALLKVA